MTARERTMDDDVHRELAQRAADADVSVPVFLCSRANRLAGDSNVAERLERTRTRIRSSALTVADTLATLDDVRGDRTHARDRTDR